MVKCQLQSQTKKTKIEFIGRHWSAQQKSLDLEPHGEKKKLDRDTNPELRDIINIKTKIG